MRKFVQIVLVGVLLVGLIAAIASIFNDYSFSSIFPEGGVENARAGGENELEPFGIQINEETGGFELGENVPVDGIPPSVPLFEVYGPTGEWLTRASVGETYENGIWSPADNAQAVSYEGGDLPQRVEECTSYQTKEATIKPVVEIGGFIPVFSHVIRVENLESLNYYPQQEIFRASASFKQAYRVNYTVYSYNEGLLKRERLDSSPEYLQLPPTVTDRTRELAQKIVENAETPYEKAKAIEGYLRRNYTYDKYYERPPSGWDPVDWFLFEENRGHCMNFNSAFVILARSVDIPSRMVFGFAIDPNAEHQLVFTDNSHANAEVRFEGVGWIPFNATASHPSAISDSDGDGMPDSWENRYGLDPSNPDDAFSDLDNDGSPNLIEYLEGTNPNDATSFPEDDDGDIIPDEWEREHGLDPSNPDDAFSDTDGDEYVNLLEYLYGTDPNDAESHPEDMDSDGMPDSWELEHSLNPMDPSDARADPDEDGFSNIQEYEARTNPKDSTSKPEGAKIPTEITIVEASGVGVKGCVIRIRGKISDESGAGVGDLGVEIYLKEEKGSEGIRCGSGVSADNGFYDIECGIGSEVQVGDYQLVAFTPGSSEYENDWSDPPIRIVSGTTLALSIPQRLDLNQTLEIKGELSENTGSGVADMSITVSINGGRIATVKTDDGGRFSENHRFSTRGVYDIEARFDGTMYYMRSSADATVEVARTSLHILGENVLIRGENAEFRGKAMFGDEPLGGERVIIQVDGSRVETSTSTDGMFETTYSLPNTLEIGSTQLAYSVPPLKFSKLHEVMIKGGTSLEVSAPSSVESGKVIRVEVLLKDDRGDPLKDRCVTLSMPGVIDSKIRKDTNSGGKASFNVRIPEDVGSKEAQLAVEYGGSSYYASSSASLPIEISGVGGGFLLVFLAVIAAVGVVGFYLWRRGLLRRVLRKAKEGKTAITDVVGKAKGAAEGVREGKISISFPQISEGLPNVWGVDEELQISCGLPGAMTGDLKGRLELEVNGENVFSRELEGERECTITHTFEGKEVKILRASFLSDSQIAEGSAEIRIVDYREEVIWQYNSFIEQLEMRGIKIGEGMTPMELRHKILDEIGDGREAVAELVRNFEVAEYSLHEVGRKEFVRTARARTDLEGELEQRKPE